MAADNEKSINVSIVGSSQYYIGIDTFPLESISEAINNRRRKSGVESSQPIYLSAENNTKFGDVVPLLDAFRKIDTSNVALIVLPAEKNNSKGSNILKVSIPPEPKDGDEPSKNKLLKYEVKLTKDGKYKFNDTDITIEALVDKLRTTFKENEDKVIFREGTNEIFKTVTIKAPKSARYGEVVRLIDEVKGAGAAPVILQVDDLEM